jgi:hypothetical protein
MRSTIRNDAAAKAMCADIYRNGEASHQPSSFIVKKWLTSSKITNSFTDISGQRERRRERRRYNNTHLTVDRLRGIESDHMKTYGEEGAYACQGINLRRGVISTNSLRGQRDPKGARDRPISSSGMGDAVE